MTVPVRKWGNSLALRIPKDIATTLSISDNTMMELVAKDGVLIAQSKDDTLLETLVSKINPKNLHKEIDTDRSVGNEEW